MKLDGLSFNKFGLECLYGQTVKGRGPVQHHRMSLQNIFKNIPYDGFFTVNQLAGRLHRFHDTSFNQFTDDKRFEQFGRHILGQSAFVQFQFRTYHDYGTTGIVNAFPEQVLAETTLFPFEYVTQ